MNEIAPDGKIYVCAACGRRSEDIYGDKPLDRGWDSSCVLNAVLLSLRACCLRNAAGLKSHDPGCGRVVQDLADLMAAAQAPKP